jgi:hypothetical protein
MGTVRAMRESSRIVWHSMHVVPRVHDGDALLHGARPESAHSLSLYLAAIAAAAA